MSDKPDTLSPPYIDNDPMNKELRVKGTETFRVPTAHDVVYNDEIVGTDPDENIRAQLLREAQTG